MSRLPVLKGTLDLLVLRALSWTPMHGFEIVSWLERAANGSLDLEDSALYQAVYRLEERGLLEADWGVTENNRRARYYKLTAAGRTHLRAETQNWMQYAETVTTHSHGAGEDAQPRRRRRDSRRHSPRVPARAAAARRAGSATSRTRSSSTSRCAPSS